MKEIIDWAEKHNLEFEPKGEVGFGRPCVGILIPEHDSYINYNPINADSYDYIFKYDDKLEPPSTVTDAYHKHDCLAVLVENEDYDLACTQLLTWIKHLDSQGEVYIEEYKTGAEGFQAIFSGVTSKCIRIRYEHN